MKKVVFIGNRLNVLKHIGAFPDLSLVKIFVQEESPLAHAIDELSSTNDVEKRYFNLKEKRAVVDEIVSLDFDILISNGCPFILPAREMSKDSQLLINIHPTLLPELKGKTPLNGVFMTHQKAIGATMHFMDDGIDTGATIAQKKVKVTRDLDQGLVYKISFDMEGAVFLKGMKLLQRSGYKFNGVKQGAEGSYFNRTRELQTIDVEKEKTDTIIDKIRSFGVKGQGSFLAINGVDYTIYAAEKIVNRYLLRAYAQIKVGEVAFTYDDKFVLKTVDGMIKITDFKAEATGIDRAEAE